jgi:hypothetical protein
VGAVEEVWRVGLGIHDEIVVLGHKVEPVRVAAEEVGVGVALVEADGHGVAHKELRKKMG